MPINDYNWVYMPEHHRAFGNGMVYEHVLVAEEMLGRELSDSEVVHHVDGHRSNNSPENLMIFHSSSDHARFHMTGRCEKLNDGTFISPTSTKDMVSYIKTTKSGSHSYRVYYDTCPLCGSLKYIRATTCMACRKRKSAKPEREVLDDLLKSYNKSEIGRMYGVSQTAVRKWIRNYQL